MVVGDAWDSQGQMGAPRRSVVCTFWVILLSLCLQRLLCLLHLRRGVVGAPRWRAARGPWLQAEVRAVECLHYLINCTLLVQRSRLRRLLLTS